MNSSNCDGEGGQQGRDCQQLLANALQLRAILLLLLLLFNARCQLGRTTPNHTNPPATIPFHPYRPQPASHHIILTRPAPHFTH